MEAVISSAPSKVNLILHSGRPDSDGYHPLVTVFEALSLRDYVVALPPEESAPGPALQTFLYEDASAEGLPPQFSSSLTEAFSVLDNEDHLAARACVALGVEVGRDVTLAVHKTIPVAGGMAGGSADAAATLVAVNELFELGKSPQELLVLGARLGADVPACLVGGISLGTGRGDQMRLLHRGSSGPGAGSHWWVLVFSCQGLSTPTVFKKFDAMHPEGPKLDVSGLVDSMEETFASLPSTDQLASVLTNDLQPPALALRPELAAVGDALMEADALGWLVSGSGPTVAGIAGSKAEAVRIASSLQGVPGVRGVAVAWGPGPGAQVEADLPGWARKRR